MRTFKGKLRFRHHLLVKLKFNKVKKISLLSHTAVPGKNLAAALSQENLPVPINELNYSLRANIK